MAKLSIFNNKWNEVFDFTFYSTDPKSIKMASKLDTNFVAPFFKVKELMTKASKSVGRELKSVKELTGIKLSDIELEFNESALQLDLGTYFSKLSDQMLRGVPPTKIGKDR
jgi:hypothetical protein